MKVARADFLSGVLEKQLGGPL
jgi:hypothetical protein